jgi:hypothetical protein
LLSQSTNQPTKNSFTQQISKESKNEKRRALKPTVKYFYHHLYAASTSQRKPSLCVTEYLRKLLGRIGVLYHKDNTCSIGEDDKRDNRLMVMQSKN